MKRNEPVTTIMSKKVHTVHPGQQVSDVRKLMVDHGIHHVPVVSGEKVIGMITASDILGISVEGVGSDQRSMDAYIDHQFSIEGLMRSDLHKIEISSTVRRAAEMLSQGDYHAIPVVDGDDTLKGIVTSTDLIRYLRDL